MTSLRVLLLGATGLVGRQLLELLLRDDAVGHVTVMARRAVGITSPKLHETTGPLEEMHRYRALFAVDAIFCALGTTMKRAGSEEAFRRVDYAFPLTAARLGREAGATHFLLVSSAGANPVSRIFYSRVKGEIERDVIVLDYPRTTIARPSFLRGERSELRAGERIVLSLSWFLPRAYKPIDAHDVARALVEAAHTQQERVAILPSRAMRRS